MEREEKYIAKEFGRRTPFKVPEGYFDNFASQVMQVLPEKQVPVQAQFVPIKANRRYYLRRVAVAAASVCVAIFGAAVILHNDKESMANNQVTSSCESYSSSSYTAVDALADYSMLDSEDMYTYLTDSK